MPPQTSLEDQAYSHIRRQLLSGGLVPGEQVRDAQIAEQIGVSRTPVREAILRLRNEGFVEQLPRLGTFVRVPDAQELIDLYEFRRLIEVYSIGKAIRQLTDDDIKQLEGYCRELRLVAAEQRRRTADHHEAIALPAELTERGIMADVNFHLLIIRCAGNRRITKVFADLHVMSYLCGYSWINLRRRNKLGVMARTYRDHCRVLRAIKQRDVNAARHWTKQHLAPIAQVKPDLERLAKNLGNPQRRDLYTTTALPSIMTLEEELTTRKTK